MSIVVAKKSFPFRGSALAVFHAFCREPHAFFLESSLRHLTLGRYSFVGSDPFHIIRAHRGDHLGRLEEAFRRYAVPGSRCPYPFPGGMLGYLSYDFDMLGPGGRRLGRKYDERIPAFVFGCYDCVIMIDHALQRLTILSTGLPHANPALRRRRAKDRLERVAEKLGGVLTDWGGNGCRLGLTVPPDGRLRLKSNFSKPDYLRAVRRALEYIRRGDIYQVNLSQRFSVCGRDDDPVMIYGALRAVFPSYFSGYFDAGDFRIISSSPERFMRLHNGVVETRPMKGTRARGRNAAEDRFQRRQLLQSRKDQAELLMITDLERNDLGRVCRYGSVWVKEMRTLEKYATVYQTTSTVSGRLERGRDAWDLLAATFPGGSITGCPKIRAMQIIDELEPTPRAVYTGILGYIGFQGDLDFNILIRTFLEYKNEIHFQVGGGIVADSDPEAEYEETLIKARAMIESLRLVNMKSTATVI